jgi:hypothetical protein
MDFPMTEGANGNLLSVDCPQDAVEAGGYPFVGKFVDVSDVMHDDWPCIRADATRFAKF